MRRIIIAALAATVLSTPLVGQEITEVQKIDFKDNTNWEQMAPGVQRKFVYGAQGMIAQFKMEKGATVPLHQHPNEQITYIAQGSVRVSVKGKDYTIKSGETLIIPANIPHSFICLEDNTIDIDFFAPPRKDWIDGTASYFKGPSSTHPALEEVAALDVRPGNVAVAKNGRIFSSIHPLGSTNYQLVEIVAGKAVPYPNAAMQKNNAATSQNTFDAILGITIDQKNRLWVSDMGLNLGRTRLYAIDISSNKIVEQIELPASVAPKGTFAQEIVIDTKNNWAYLADIANPGIIAINLSTKKARRFSGHSSLQAEDLDMVIDGKTIHFGGQPARVAIDPLTLSSDGETLFFGAMNGTKWYALPARLLRQERDDNTIGKAIKIVGEKPISDGAFTDKKGNHYFTDLQHHAITRLSADGENSILVKATEKLLWPDNVYIADDGYAYISANQLNSTPAFTGGKDEGKAPFYIYKFKL